MGFGVYFKPEICIIDNEICIVFYYEIQQHREGDANEAGEIVVNRESFSKIPHLSTSSYLQNMVPGMEYDLRIYKIPGLPKCIAFIDRSWLEDTRGYLSDFEGPFVATEDDYLFYKDKIRTHLINVTFSIK